MSLKVKLNTRHPKAVWVKMMKSNPEYFHEALTLAISGEHPEGWRAAWLLGHTMHRNDQRLQPLMMDLIQALKGKQSGQQRELLKILAGMELEEVHEGPLFDACLAIWEDLGKQSSVRVTAFRQLVRIAWEYPDLKQELRHFTTDAYTASLSPGIKRSIEKLVKKLVVS